MAHLTLAGASDDGRHLRLVDEDGVEHTLEVTTAVRSAIGGRPPRPGSRETTMDSALRPRDIQARIRAGESPETVAEAARTTVDKIMVFARPVLAEREHVAQRAQGSSVRRSGAGEGGARTLGQAVEAHLHALNLDPTLVEWDAWRREDGRWTLTATYETTPREGIATFTFDAPGNYVLLEDDDARWLVGEIVASSAPAPADDDLSARRRRLNAVPGEPTGAPADIPAGTPAAAVGTGPADPDQLELGDDALEMVAESHPAETWLDDDRAPRPGRETEPELDLGVTAPAGSDDDTREQPAAREQDEQTDQQADQQADQQNDQQNDQQADQPVPPRRPAKKRGRASVPSWDEIMFGGGDQ